MAITPEARLTRRLISAINRLPNTYCEKVYGGGGVGNPTLDVLGCRDGKMFYLEVKVPGKKPTKRQESTMRKWRKKGGCHTGWVDSVEAALDFVECM